MKWENRTVTISLVAISLLTFPSLTMASTDTKTLIIKAKIDKVAKLVVDTNTISFPNMDPDEVNLVPAIQNDVKVTVKARTGSSSPVNLHVMADGDLISGVESIPVQNVTWQASGAGFIGGTLSKSSVQAAGSWTGSGIRQGSFRYFLNNSWNYQKGDYQVTVTYTLTTP